jgi:putative transposase
VFYTDHGSDFTSQHMEQVAADLRMRLVFSLPGQPRGRGKVERYMDTINQMCLPALPGHAPRGTKDRASQARLSLAELDAALGAFIVNVYNNRVHSETGHPRRPAGRPTGSCPTCHRPWNNSTCYCLPSPNPARSTLTASGSKDCATSTQSWPLISANQ